MRYLVSLVIMGVACCFLPSCSSDDGDEPDSVELSQQTLTAIQETFPSFRIDSIHSTTSNAGGTAKMKYDGNLLVSYKSFTVKWGRDTIYISSGDYNKYRAVIGDNGCVKMLICPNGKENYYEYDSNRNLIRYDVDVASVSDKQYYELTWEDGNVVQFRDHYKYYDSDYEYDDSWHYCDYFYSYGTTLNIVGILPICNGCWINDTGLSVGYGINYVLYYAGILGNKTTNLPISFTFKYESGQKPPQPFSFTYQLNSDGVVTSSYTNGSSPSYVGTYFYR